MHTFTATKTIINKNPCPTKGNWFCLSCWFLHIHFEWSEIVVIDLHLSSVLFDNGHQTIKSKKKYLFSYHVPYDLNASRIDWWYVHFMSFHFYIRIYNSLKIAFCSYVFIISRSVIWLLTNISAICIFFLLLLLLHHFCIVLLFVSLHFSRFFRYVDSSDMFTLPSSHEKVALTMSVTRLNGIQKHIEWIYLYKNIIRAIYCCCCCCCCVVFSVIAAIRLPFRNRNEWWKKNYFSSGLRFAWILNRFLVDDSVFFLG